MQAAFTGSNEDSALLVQAAKGWRGAGEITVHSDVEDAQQTPLESTQESMTKSSIQTDASHRENATNLSMCD